MGCMCTSHTAHYRCNEKLLLQSNRLYREIVLNL